ncbi:unnamed protein product [Microthlaspi erraticum]|uniref:MATH domain-containing protein n=1 Tax=Microthlaspi erraticum TaxID=1685480 RepID=A0A6D2JP36_9BRAS|nr:unnamed protein product [Microthlaspi erraticum]
MKSHYRNTISLVYLLLCLFITSASSASSFIRQFTDDFDSYLPQKERTGARLNPNLDKDAEISFSSRDHKVSASSTVKGLRERPPSSYSLKMEYFNIVLESTNLERYQSRPFSVGGYSWTLVVYPNGNKKDNGAGYLSLYVAIDNSTLLAAQKDVYADLRFYIFNSNERQYFTIQDTNVWRFNVFKTMWGFSKVLPVETFKDPSNGYLYDGDHCQFGVDVTLPTTYEKSELLTLTDHFNSPRYTWTIQRFSTLLQDEYNSDVFTIGGRRWKINVCPNGCSSGEGVAMSMYLLLDENDKVRPYEKIYVRAKLRVLNKNPSNNLEKQVDAWYDAPGYGPPGYGRHDFIPLSDLRDSSKGFVVNDVLKVQVEIEAISLTKYFPS